MAYVKSYYLLFQLERRQRLCVLAEEAKEGEGPRDVDMIEPDSPSTKNRFVSQNRLLI